MPSKFDATPGNGKTLLAEGIILKQVVVTGGSAVGEVKIYEAGNLVADLKAPINDTRQLPFIDPAFGGLTLKGPVTYDLIGTGSSVVFRY